MRSVGKFQSTIQDWLR